MLKTPEVQKIVLGEITAALLDQEDGLEEISLDDTLMQVGLNSLILAQLLIQLETELGVDPFEADRSITDMRTIRDLVDAYDQALSAPVTA
jgi:acyl carrier protein